MKISRSAARAVVPAALALAVAAAGCSSKPSGGPDPVRPVKTLIVTAGGDAHVRAFPGRVEASKRAEISFQVPGLITSLPVKEGQKVAKGEVIAQLRQDEFQARVKTLQGQYDQARAALRALQAGERSEQRLRLEAGVRAAEAKLANARTEFNRAQSLFASRAVARAEVELRQTELRVAHEEHQAALQLLEKSASGRDEDIEAQEAQVRAVEGRLVEANLQLQDSTLRAPFDGVIAQRFVEENQTVQAKAPVVRFQDVEEVEVAVDVPEAVMVRDVRTADILSLVAELSGAPGLQFPVRIKEVAQTADSVTQTFQIRVAMKAPPDLRVLPGMTATVTATYRRAGVLGGRILVPVSAVIQAPDGQQVAWVVAKDGTVSRRAVKLGEATGGRIEVVDGLQDGDRIAVAGASFLRDGMTVRDLGDALGGVQP